MREILFKGKRADNGKWEVGCLIILPNGDCEIWNRCINPPDGDPIWEKSIITHKVDSSTICQYTGLTDKNGNKIWENDVVERVDRRNGLYVFREQPKMNCKVVWTDRHGYDTVPSCGYFDMKNALECEVIGNIFDNPELLRED